MSKGGDDGAGIDMEEFFANTSGRRTAAAASSSKKKSLVANKGRASFSLLKFLSPSKEETAAPPSMLVAKSGANGREQIATQDEIEEYSFANEMPLSIPPPPESPPPPPPSPTPRHGLPPVSPVLRAKKSPENVPSVPKSPLVSPRMSTHVSSNFFPSTATGRDELQLNAKLDFEEDEDVGFDNPLHTEESEAEAKARATIARRNNGSFKVRKRGTLLPGASVPSSSNAPTVGSKKELDYDLVFKPKRGGDREEVDDISNDPEFQQASEFEW